MTHYKIRFVALHPSHSQLIVSFHHQHWILDGFPRTLGQGQLLDAHLRARNAPLNLIVNLDVPDRVVYSAHVYAWSGWGSSEGRYAKRAYASFVRAMRRNWGYLVEGDVAPVWIGEFGAPHHPGVGDVNYWQNLMRYLKAIDADFGYWAINPRKPKDDEKEGYCLVEDDWVTPVLDYRMRDMTELMRA